ncbi:glycoside hydrolase family protein [Aeromonas sobria]|uniref:glycoside hydrolase family protein n=1 Tax=Aeromonas sobria TaxID=646 RepID=UPI000C6D8E01|nr:glycoside hydrolase family protein [Aeromonas sobria]PKQ78095.1 hypothetical protein CJF47_07385 [Aeromonas sobria]
MDYSRTELSERLKEHEGTLEYQEHKNIFRNGLFFPYKDSLGFWTIGYGHLIKKGESFLKGITPKEADNLLLQDIAIAELQIKQLIKEPASHSAVIQMLLIEMVFQLGITKAMKFVKFRECVEARDYAGAARELKSSAWFKQTPNRVQGHINVLKLEK